MMSSMNLSTRFKEQACRAFSFLSTMNATDRRAQCTPFLRRLFYNDSFMYGCLLFFVFMFARTLPTCSSGFVLHDITCLGAAYRAGERLNSASSF